MTATRTPTETRNRRPNRLAEKLLADKHSLPLSLALHLVPGGLITAVYLLWAEPFVLSLGYPPFLAWAIALGVVLYPMLAGLYWLGRYRNGRNSLAGVLHYTGKPISRGKIAAIIAVAIVWMTVVSLLLVPVDNWFYEQFFTWVQYEGAGGSATTYIDGYSHNAVLVTMVICLPFTGFTLPLVEEFYFRGFLLPRLPQLKGWAPLLNTVLFTVYHFWSPWTYLSKIVFLFPAVWLVWKRKDIRISIGMHPGTALLMAVVGTIAIAAGAM